MNFYIMNEHREAIANFAKTKKVAISFREAGESTISRLRLGCPCKGHEVLEKSIKEKSLLASNVDNSALGSLQKLLPNLYGLIGHWSPTKDNKVYVEGVYLSEYGVANLKIDPFLKTLTLCERPTNNGSKAYYPNIVKITVDLCCNLDIWADLKKKKNYNRFFLTGDYDLHDMIEEVSGKSYVVFDPNREKLLQEELNLYLNEQVKIHPRVDEPPYCTIDEETKKKIEVVIDKKRENELNFIRHGAQVNYPSHMLNNEGNERLVLGVVLPDLNLEAVDKMGNFSKIHTLADLQAWYTRNNAVMKHTFVTCKEDSSEVIKLLNRNQPMSTIIKNTVQLLREYLIRTDIVIYPFELTQIDDALSGVIRTFYFQLINLIPSLYSNKKNRELPMLELLDDKLVDVALTSASIDFNRSREVTKEVENKTLCETAAALQDMLYKLGILYKQII